MKLKYIYIVALLALGVGACDELDPTEGIENPNLLLENVIGSAGSTALWLVGEERQMAILYNQLLELTEIGSDNYVNTQTFFNQRFDGLVISFKETDVNELQFRIADLRESATVGLEKVLPADPAATDKEKAELLFFQGWAKLLAGELFVALPLEAGGVPVSPTENVNSAIEDFLEAEKIEPENAGYKLALARAYHYLGDKTKAVTKAKEALAIDPTYLRSVEFDGANLPDNDFADALFQRGGFDDLQPLPRLDFLDPKYRVEGEVESPVYIQKAEEAYLILAEADLVDDDLADAKKQMTDLLKLVKSRKVEEFDDSVEDRADRPDSSDYKVRASPDDPFIAGLILCRNKKCGEVEIPVISGTSVTQAQIDALGNVTDALETLYLMRQQIFIAEGRRFVDLGIKMPVSEIEQLTNDNVTEVHITSFIPEFIPKDMDKFTVNAEAREVTITHNMNAVLVENRTDASVVPFF